MFQSLYAEGDSRKHDNGLRQTVQEQAAADDLGAEGFHAAASSQAFPVGSQGRQGRLPHLVGRSHQGADGHCQGQSGLNVCAGENGVGHGDNTAGAGIGRNRTADCGDSHKDCLQGGGHDHSGPYVPQKQSG